MRETHLHCDLHLTTIIAQVSVTICVLENHGDFTSSDCLCGGDLRCPTYTGWLVNDKCRGWLFCIYASNTKTDIPGKFQLEGPTACLTGPFRCFPNAQEAHWLFLPAVRSMVYGISSTTSCPLYICTCPTAMTSVHE